MTRREVCNSMTLQDAIQVFRDTNAYGTMDLAKTVILEALGDPAYISKLTQKAYEDGKKDGYTEANASAINTEQIIKDTIKEYIGEFYLDTDDLLLTLSKDLCERIRKGE